VDNFRIFFEATKNSPPSEWYKLLSSPGSFYYIPAIRILPDPKWYYMSRKSWEIPDEDYYVQESGWRYPYDEDDRPDPRDYYDPPEREVEDKYKNRKQSGGFWKAIDLPVNEKNLLIRYGWSNKEALESRLKNVTPNKPDSEGIDLTGKLWSNYRDAVTKAPNEKHFEIKIFEAPASIYIKRIPNRKNIEFMYAFYPYFLTLLAGLEFKAERANSISIDNAAKLPYPEELDNLYKQMLSPRGYSFTRNERFGRLVVGLEKMGFIKVVLDRIIPVKTIQDMSENPMGMSSVGEVVGNLI
jgi:hypothetical protein